MLTVKLINRLGALFLILRFHIPKFITQMCKEIYEFCMEGRCENKIELLGDTQEEMNTDR